MDLTVILLRPEHPGNVGAIARAMANFGFTKLAIVEPACVWNADEAMHRATHAKALLRNAQVGTTALLKEFDTLIATTAMLGTEHRITRSPISPVLLTELPLHGRIGLLIGPEAHGLSNAEIARCDFVVTIPTNVKHPTMNVSHAVAILLYELSKCTKLPKSGSHVRHATAADKAQVLHTLDRAMAKLDFRSEGKRETQRKVWRRLLGKSFLTKREAMALMGFLKKLV